VPAEVTEGMVLSRMAINGQPVDITSNAAPPTAGAEGARSILNQQAAQANAASQNTLVNGRSTNARVRLGTPILPGARAVLEVDWSHKVPGGPGTGHR
jgi:hypothetical protein